MALTVKAFSARAEVIFSFTAYNPLTVYLSSAQLLNAER